MPEYAPEGAGDAFAQSRACFAGMEEWLSGPVAAGLTHAELEEQLGARGRELPRRLHQDHLDLRAAREQRREKVTGCDGKGGSVRKIVRGVIDKNVSAGNVG